MKLKNTKGVVPFRSMATACAICACATSAHAFEIDTGDSELKLRWDNTVKYTAATRLEDPSAGLNTPDDDNQDDGNNNFDKGLVSNRLDLFSEFDLSYGNVGARISAAAWHDAVYQSDTDNETVFSNHAEGNEFSDETKRIMGGDTELLDAFVYARIPVGEGTGTVRLGRHSVLWGESLFYGANGIAGGMAPIDVVKLQSVPNTTFKEAARPIGKLSADIPLTENVSVGAYIGYEWEKSRLPPAGAFLSASDVLEGENIITGPIFSGAPTFERAPDQEPSDDGQYGVKVSWYNENLNTDFGVYALRYNAFGPSSNNLLIVPPPAGTGPTAYRWAYHEGIEAVGLSFAKSISNWSLAGEMSYRDNVPLASRPQFAPSFGAYAFDNKDNPGYAVGSTAHAQFSWLASMGPSFISREAVFLGEIAWNERMGVDKQEALLNPNSDTSATAIRIIYKPTYRQALSGLDLSPSLGFSHAWGKSSALGSSFGVDGGGDLTLGLDAIYMNKWKIGMKYITYLGQEGGTLDANNFVQYKQALKDRDFMSLSISTTF